MPLSRRQMVVSAAAFLAFGSHRATKRLVHPAAEKPLQRHLELGTTGSTQDMLRELLKIHDGSLSVSLGELGRDGNFSPDNVAGGTSIYAGMTGTEYVHRLPESGEEMLINSSGNLLMAGGPVGSIESRIAFEFTGPENNRMERKTAIIPLRWYGLANHLDPRVAEQRKLFYLGEDGEPREAFNWPLVDLKQRNNYISAKGGARATEKADWMEDNYLTVTRIPNFLSESAEELIRKAVPPSEWPHFVMLDGRNGIGTRGAALLASSAGQDALRKATDHISKLGSSSYQVIFHLTNLDKERRSEFKRIEYYDHDTIPIDLEVLRKARAYAKQRLRADTRDI